MIIDHALEVYMALEPSSRAQTSGAAEAAGQTVRMGITWRHSPFRHSLLRHMKVNVLRFGT
jgi:hypothetical protein